MTYEGGPLLSVQQIQAKTARLKQQAASRDQRMSDVLNVRRGDANAVVPGMFPPDWPKPIIANFVDVAARDLAELVAPLPSVNCAVANMGTDSARKFAARKTKVAQWYIQYSELERQMFQGADRYLSYGFLPIYIEPDFDARVPRLCLEDPIGAYPEFDRWGRVVSYSKRWLKTVDELVADWPEFEPQLRNGDYEHSGNALLELWRYCDKDQITLYVPQRENLVLARAKNYLGKTPCVVAIRPSLEDDEPVGQFDDVLWVQLARARMALLGLEAAEKSVTAPLAVPSDVQEMVFGADAVIRTSQPQNVRRVGVELPTGAFAESQMLDQEMRVGARYPGARSGEQNASVITGRGIQELMGGFDTQVKTAQSILGHSLKLALQLCFEMDEKLWGGVTREIRGEANGAPFSETYRPDRDIKGDYTVRVDYGFAAGMDPNRAVVFLLQLHGDKVIDRDTIQRQLPWDVDVVKLQESIDAEELNDALKAGVLAYLQALPALIQSGADPSTAIRQAATIIKDRQAGKPLADAALEAFAPQPPPGDEEAGESPPPPGAAPAGPPGGPFSDVIPGQIGPGGRPDLETMLAGLTAGGKPNLSSNIQRRIPAA